MLNTEQVLEHTNIFLTCDTIPGDVGNCLHTVVTITQTVIKNAMHDNGWMEGKRKKKREGMRMIFKHI